MKVVRTFLRGLDGASRVLPRFLTGAPVIAGEALDPFLQWLLWLRVLRGTKAMWQMSPSAARLAFRKDVLPLSAGFEVGEVRSLRLQGAEGPLNARLYRKMTEGVAPAVLVYFHGGGFVVGDLDTHDDVCRLICQESGMAVLAVDYRLAPEHPFPAPLDDAIAATRWAHANSHQLGVRSGHVLVGGDSAGANLAAVTALTMAREGMHLDGQLLFYPGTDLGGDWPSRCRFGKGLFLTEEDRAWFYGHYLHGNDGTDPRISPLRHTLFHGVCPAVIVTAALDMLRDEGEAYARALRASGVLVEMSRAQSLGHGFVNLIGVHTASREATRAAVRLCAAMHSQKADWELSTQKRKKV